jgi:hypothetical protein
MRPTLRDGPALDDGGLRLLAGGLSPGPHPFSHPSEHLAEVQIDVRRSRHDHRLGPAIRELPLENSQSKFGPNVNLACNGRDHPGFKIGLSLPNESLEGLVGFALPSHPVAQRFRGDTGQLRRGLAIAPTTDRVVY